MAYRSDAHRARNDQARSLFDSLRSAADSPPTHLTVTAQAKALNVAHDVEDIPNSHGARLHYLGKRNGQKVLLYFHGGGFAMPPIEAHITFLVRLAEKLFKSKGQELTIAFLEYTLSDVAKFPTQILQSTAALNHLLAQGIDLSDIVIGGDSAGGNLVASVISQVLHPMEGSMLLHLAQPLAGAFMISPWISFDQDTKSFKENLAFDICTPALYQWMADAYVPPERRNNYSVPYLADSSWWRGFPVKSVLNIWGGAELLRDHIASFGETLSSAGVNVRNIECPLHVHIDCILDVQSGLESGVMADELSAWLAEILTLN